MPCKLKYQNPMAFYWKYVWHWTYKAPGRVGSTLYDITIVFGPKDMSLQKYSLISQKI